jgi:short subunit dehydrogenase-like uncharacterized protein
MAAVFVSFNMRSSVLLYGATGYTGRLIIEEAMNKGLPLVLAGRNQQTVSALASEYELPYRVADLSNPAQLDSILKEMPVVLHAAGPFAVTAQPMIAACLRNNVHYLDITGEIGVFEYAHSLNKQAIEAGIMLLPGCGFDVVPTDSMASWLHEQLPDATHFELAFVSVGGGVSHGTASSMVAKLGEGGAIRKNGVIIPQPLGKQAKWIDFEGKKFFVMSIPWGDVSTAYYTTGIPNVITYTGMPPMVYRLLKVQSLFNWLLRKRAIRQFLQRKIDQRSAGPDAAMRAASYSMVKAQVRNQDGMTKAGFLKGPDGYTMTARASVLIAGKVLQGQFKAGFQTPAGCYGNKMVLEIDGVHRQLIDKY